LEAWLTDHWWWLFLIGAIGSVAVTVHRVRERGGEESLPARVMYSLSPLLDPKSEERQRFVSSPNLMKGAGLVFLLVAFLLVLGVFE
jgi:hypothetical protein